MNSNTGRNTLDLFSPKIGAESDFAADDFKRGRHYYDDSCSILVDTHLRHDARIYYLRITSESAPKKVRIFGSGTTNRILEDGDMGVLLEISYEGHQYTVWLPTIYGQFLFDDHRRIATSYSTYLYCQWELHPHIQLNVLTPGRLGEIAIIPCMVAEDADGQFFEELSFLSDIERRLYRKSDWFFAKTPSDVWNYLINGTVYDPRSDRRVGKRFKCQQCAYAWWTYFDFLHKQTGKKVYAVMQDEVAYSVLLDMSASGEWGHGYWSDDIETHARFHLDGLHLLISQYEKTNKSIWLDAAERGMAFVSKRLTERLDDDSLWFLHDTIEQTGSHHFKSTLFGKTPGNSLCVNTHVQTLTVLHRLLLAVPDKKLYAEMFNKGLRALRRVLDHQPGEVFYKLLISWIVRHKIRNKPRSIWAKLKNSFGNRILPRVYWTVVCRFPRLVHPGGLTERDLTLSLASDRYHVTNLKDFLTLYRQEPLPWLRPYIIEGASFLRKFVSDLDMTNALESSPYYIEFIDILYLYDELIEPLPYEEINSFEEKIYQQTGGYSLDYYASELVRGQ